MSSNNESKSSLQERYELAISGSREGLWDWNVITNELYLSPRWKEMIGYEDHEIANEFNTFANNIHPDDFEKVMSGVEKHFQTQDSGIDLIIRMKHKNGNYIWINDKGKAIFDKDGKPTRMLGFHSDIDDIMQSKRRLSLLEHTYENTNDAIFIIDSKTSKFIDTNSLASIQLGYTPEKLLQMSISDIKYNFCDENLFKQRIDQIRSQGTIIFNDMHQRRDGSTFPVEIHEMLIPFEGEEYIVSTVRNLTKEEEYKTHLKNQKAFLDAILENVTDGIISCNEDGVLEYFNQATKNLHGLDKKDIPPSEWANYYDLYQADGTTPMNMEDIPLFKALQDGKVEKQEMVIKVKDKKAKRLIANGQRMLDENGDSIGAVVSMHDITDLKEAIEEAQNANLSKSTFLANMSHEIRTPMNAILGFSELLRNSGINEEAKQQLDVIHSSARSLLTLINDILDLSKIESGKMEIQNIDTDIFKILEDMHDLFKLKLHEKNLDFKINSNLKNKNISIDEIRLKQILQNLISNAIKFTEKGSISVDAHISDSNLIIIVKDTGIGVKENQREHIFGAFEQQKGQEYRTFGGTGLGLSISKKLANLMGGDISVKANKPHGSLFSIEFDDVKLLNNAQDINKTDLANLKLPNIKVLIVDDIMTNRLLLDAYFDETDVNVFEAANGLEAIEMAKEHNPDIILMDIKMPVMDGIQATKILKKDPKTKHILISALTADIVNKEKENIIKEGFDYCLTKPISKDELFFGILDLLEK